MKKETIKEMIRRIVKEETWRQSVNKVMAPLDYDQDFINSIADLCEIVEDVSRYNIGSDINPSEKEDYTKLQTAVKLIKQTTFYKSKSKR